MEPIMGTRGHTPSSHNLLSAVSQLLSSGLSVSVIPVYPCYCYLSGGRLHAETGMDARQADTYDDKLTHCQREGIISRNKYLTGYNDFRYRMSGSDEEGDYTLDIDQVTLEDDARYVRNIQESSLTALFPGSSARWARRRAWLRCGPGTPG